MIVCMLGKIYVTWKQRTGNPALPSPRAANQRTDAKKSSFPREDLLKLSRMLRVSHEHGGIHNKKLTSKLEI